MQRLGTGGNYTMFKFQSSLYTVIKQHDKLCITHDKLCTNLYQVDSGPQNMHDTNTGKEGVAFVL